MKPGVLALSFLATFTPSLGEKDQLREALGDRWVEGPWIYDDLEAGIAEGKKSGKPLLVVLRCVP